MIDAQSVHLVTHILGEWAKKHTSLTLSYSQAVRIGNIVKISGQGQSNLLFPSSQTKHWFQAAGFRRLTQHHLRHGFRQTSTPAFANVGLALRTAGSKGWSKAYGVRSCHIPVDEKATATNVMVRNLQQ